MLESHRAKARERQRERGGERERAINVPLTVCMHPGLHATDYYLVDVGKHGRDVF